MWIEYSVALSHCLPEKTDPFSPDIGQATKNNLNSRGVFFLSGLEIEDILNYDSNCLT